MRKADIHTVPMSSPEDVSAIRKLFDDGIIDPSHVDAIIAQTEGDGFARGYSAQSLQLLFAERLGLSMDAIFDRIPMLMIGGTAGLMSPHYTLFVNKPSDGGVSQEKRLSVGVASTRELQPEEYGTTIQSHEVRKAVETAMTQSGITKAEDVKCVEIKVPGMTVRRIQQAQERGKEVANSNPVVASGMGRGASALGAALALGEVAESQVSDDIIGKDSSVFTRKASASSGSEQRACRVVVIGNVTGSPSDFIAGSGVMENQLDLCGAYSAFEDAGLRVHNGSVHPDDRSRIATVFINAGADYSPDVLGRRHTMRSDFLSAWSGHQAKAVCHAVVSSIVGDTLILANAGAEHQGPPGSNLICVLAKA